MDVLDSQITGLLLGTILLDTVNLDPRAARMTNKDKEVVQQLQDKYPVALDELYRSVSTGWLTLYASLRNYRSLFVVVMAMSLALGILALSLCPANTQLDYPHMAGKSPQPGHEPTDISGKKEQKEEVWWGNTRKQLL